MIQGGINVDELKARLRLESKNGVLSEAAQRKIADAIEQNRREYEQRSLRRRGAPTAPVQAPVQAPPRRSVRPFAAAAVPQRAAPVVQRRSRSRSSSRSSVRSRSRSSSRSSSVRSSPAKSPAAKQTLQAANRVLTAAESVMKTGTAGLASGLGHLGSALQNGATWALQWGAKRLARAMEADADALNEIRENNKILKELGIYEGHRNRDAVHNMRLIVENSITNAQNLASVAASLPGAVMKGAQNIHATARSINRAADRAASKVYHGSRAAAQSLVNFGQGVGENLRQKALFPFSNWPQRRSFRQSLDAEQMSQYDAQLEQKLKDNIYRQLDAEEQQRLLLEAQRQLTDKELEEAYELDNLLLAAHGRYANRQLQNANLPFVLGQLPKLPKTPKTPQSPPRISPTRLRELEERLANRISPTQLRQIQEQLANVNRELVQANDRLGLVGRVTTEDCLTSAGSGKSPSCDNFIRSLSPENFNLFINQIRSESTKEILRLVRESGKDRTAILEAKANFTSIILPSFRQTNVYRARKGQEPLQIPSFSEYYLELLRRPAVAPPARRVQQEAAPVARPRIALPAAPGIGRLGNRAIALPGQQVQNVNSPKSIGRAITSFRIKVRTGRLEPQQAANEFRSLFNPGQYIDPAWIRLIENPALPQPNDEMFDQN
jgi:hypothetical protein